MSRVGKVTTQRGEVSVRIVPKIKQNLQPLQEHLLSHALETFGSAEKARHWMNRPNPLFDGKKPSQVLVKEPERVEVELVRIDHGVYV